MANRATPDPADGLAVEGPEVLSVGVSRQIRREDTDQSKGDNYPAVGPIFAHTAAQIAFGEQRGTSQQKERDGQRDQRRVGEECGEPAPPIDCEANIGNGPHDSEER